MAGTEDEKPKWQEAVSMDVSTSRRDSVSGVVFAVFFAVFFVVMMAHVVPMELPFSSPDPPIDCDEGWVAADGTSVSVSRLYEYTGAGQTISISRQLPDTLYGDSYLNFNARNIAFTVYVDGEVRYRYAAADPLGSGALESCFQHVPIGTSLAGKTITIETVAFYDDSFCAMPDMALCSVNDYGLYYLERHGVSFVLSLLVVFVGLIIVVQYFLVAKRFRSNNSLALGVGSIAAGLWMALESQVPFLLLSSLSSQMVMLDLLMLYLAPYPAMVFACSIMSHRLPAAEYIVLVANVVLGVAAGACMLSGTLDFHQSFVFLYALYAILIVCMTIAIARSTFLIRKNPTSMNTNWMVHIGVAVCFLAIVFTFVAYIVGGRFAADSSPFLSIGFVVMQVVILADFLMKGNRNSHAAAQSEAMRKLAYVDALTGIGNRTAFDMACDELEESVQEETFDFLLACFDVDDLKRVNDTFGHEVGDEHLISASRLLKEAFGPIGQVFRIGGDEFDALVSVENPRAAFARALGRLRELEEEHNELHPERKLRISCGVCLFSETPNRTMREVSVRADAAMYEDKAAHQVA